MQLTVGSRTVGLTSAAKPRRVGVVVVPSGPWGSGPASTVQGGPTCCPSKPQAPLGRLPFPARGSVAARFANELNGDSYVCLGLAHCFEKVDGRLVPRLVIEPVSASSLECMANGARTSFKLVTGTSMAAAVQRDKSQLPAEFSEGVFCGSFLYRCEAAARTWLRPHAQDNLMDLVPLGKTRSGFNFSLDDKRILNMENVVNDSDNIKQDISIDVYGRKTAEDAKAAAASSTGLACKHAKQQEEEEEDELDMLLTA